MLEIHVHLYSILREKLPPETKGQVLLLMDKGTMVSDLLKELDITGKVVISVNGVHEADPSRLLCDGDQVKIFSSISGG
ncbi:MoaD/ThiS family protein [Chloroflexota bacterium]